MSEILFDGVNYDDFRNTIDNQNVVVTFTSPAWCQPCRQFEPHWRTAAGKSDLLFVKVDMGESPEDTGAHWATYALGVMGVPSVFFFGEAGEVITLKSRAVVPLLKEIESLL